MDNEILSFLESCEYEYYLEEYDPGTTEATLKLLTSLVDSGILSDVGKGVVSGIKGVGRGIKTVGNSASDAISKKVSEKRGKEKANVLDKYKNRYSKLSGKDMLKEGDKLGKRINTAGATSVGAGLTTTVSVAGLAGSSIAIRHLNKKIAMLKSDLKNPLNAPKAKEIKEDIKKLENDVARLKKLKTISKFATAVGLATKIGSNAYGRKAALKANVLDDAARDKLRKSGWDPFKDTNSKKTLRDKIKELK